MMLLDIPVPTWRDILDILFLTIVAYQLYNWFRETSALRVLIGLAVLGPFIRWPGSEVCF